jgi:hypothetical protein
MRDVPESRAAAAHFTHTRLTMNPTEIHLRKSDFTRGAHTLLDSQGLSVELFTFDTGVEAVRLRNLRGELVVLPYLGQMIWSARFDGVNLAMGSPFQAPRQRSDLLGTYGCFLYHSGLLRNGNPGPRDSHALHGEMPCARMDRASLRLGSDAQGPWLALRSEVDYLQGFGDHYLAQPSVVLRPDSALFEVRMDVRNLGRDPMDLMYMCHANFAFVEGGQLVQPTGFSARDTAVRRAIPAIVQSDPAYVQRLAAMADDPSSSEWLNEPDRFNPELVFYLRGLRTDHDGLARHLLKRPEGGAFSVRYSTDAFPHTIRWILHNHRAQVCGFAMPATCEVEGHAAELDKGHVRSLGGGEQACFSVTMGYLDAQDAAAEEALIRRL